MNYKHIIGAVALSTATTTAAGITLIDDDFSSTSLSKDSTLTRNSSGWHAQSTSSWQQGTTNQWMHNISNTGGVTSDGALATAVSLSGLGLTNEKVLEVNFSFASWDGSTNDNIYVHLWGLKNVAPTDLKLANLNAQNGSMWASAVNNGFDVYNLGTGVKMTTDGDGSAANAAIKLENQTPTPDQSVANAIHFSTTFDLGGYDLNTIDSYDYLVMGFARNPGVGTGNKFALFDVQVSAVPEPSTAALISIGAISLTMRRKR